MTPTRGFDGVAAANPLLSLAKSRDPTDREQLLAGLVDLCEAQGRDLPPEASAQVEAIFLALVRAAERDIRARLSERLASADWPPPSLIETLARDDIEVARPVIAASPLLKDEALIRLITEATLTHKVEVAQRPRLSAAVVEAVIDQAEPAVLTALAGNVTADISAASLRRLVDHAREIPALAPPLVAHPRMSSDLAEALYLWVGQALRSAIVARFDVDTAALDAAIAQAMTQDHPAHAGPTPAEVKLVEKLAQSGQLKAGYLLRVLKDHQLGLFEASLAKLGGFQIAEVRTALASEDRPELLALACAAVGIDRGAFPTILQLVRQCNDGRPGGGDEGARRAVTAFGPFSPDIAASAFRQAINAL
ncbi:MAG TPA: DUF2336 domain-containing protein [Caulobacteraceae bacterium]